MGNVTSQIFANIYLHELDSFIKRRLRIKYYLRYADDFVILDEDEKFLASLIPVIREFLKNELRLDLHPQKLSIQKFRQGIDFLGYVCLPYYRTLRTKTKKRMFNNLRKRKGEVLAGTRTGESLDQTAQSYLGMLKHANTYRLTKNSKAFVIDLPKESSI